MDVEGGTLPIHPNLSCKVCGEKEFEQREGFYYCQECGTKQDQLRIIEIEHDDDFDDTKKKAKKHTIQAVKVEKPQLTSWECYNYILRGFVEELLSLGAKEELKLMALQVWAVYLRRMEIAFFNKKQPDLPKLGVIYLQNDAKAIYNHSKQARKKRKRKSGDGDTSCTSGGESMSAKDFRKSKRKLDESIYSLTSASGASGLTSSTSANSNRAIKLGFNTKARKFLKTKMPVQHLKKHETDAEGLLECHKQPKTREIKHTDYAMMLMNTRQVYCVLAIALNLIGDEIQLCDLLRFVHEGHIGRNKVLQYFPENIANYGKAMLRKINFYKNPDKYSEKPIREHISMVCKNIGIQKLKTPNMLKIVRRYVSELCLPSEIGTFIERLINILPPQFDTRAVGVYPAYEARAMAYIIFVLKLLFGLDGYKEQRMSEASKKLNGEIQQQNRKNNEKQPLLFVWSEWVQYIEMRKVIVSHFNSTFCDQFNQCQSTEQLLQQMTEEVRRNDEQDHLTHDGVEHIMAKQRLENFKTLFERFQGNFKNTQTEEKKPTRFIDFKPSFTPGLSYFKSILRHCDNENSLSSDAYFKVPDFMRIDHTQYDVKSYLQVKPLIGYFLKNEKELKVYVLPSNKDRSYVGVFRAPRTQFRGWEHLITRSQKACFNITEEEWAQNVAQVVTNSTDDLEFKKDLDNYEKRYFQKRNRILNIKNNACNASMNYDLSLLHNSDNEQNESTPTEGLPKTISEYCKKVLNLSEGNDIRSLHSFDMFRENNMDPIQSEDFIKCPRRDLDETNMFDGISDEESVLNEADDNNEHNAAASFNCENDEPASIGYVTSTTSREFMTSPQEEFLDINSEIYIKQEVDDAISDDRGQKSSRKEKPQEDKSLKLYVSNMDCWMLLGNILMLSKAQKTQLQDKFPRSFSWLLKTCAQTLGVEWSAVYEQLLTIELMFCMGTEDPKEIKNCVYMKSMNPIKDFQMLINNYREIW